MPKIVFGNISNFSNNNLNDNLKGENKRLVENRVVQVNFKKSKVNVNNVNVKKNKRRSNYDEQNENITKSLERKVKRICIQNDRKALQHAKQKANLEKENSFESKAPDNRINCNPSFGSHSSRHSSASFTSGSLVTINNSSTSLNESTLLESNKRESAKSPTIIVLDDTVVNSTDDVEHQYDPFDDYEPPQDLPENVEDYDKSQLNDVFSEPNYARDIFAFYKQKEMQYLTKKYLHTQNDLTKSMRAVLIDWLVEIQESFELNHETLYLAIKIIDQYLMQKKISRSDFQLLGATAMLIAAKYDERLPPACDDFLYICDDAYDKRNLILMEMEVLATLDFCIGFPLSYRFLRRYARV
jgi:G2/mitotic-specific cyclin-B3